MAKDPTAVRPASTVVVLRPREGVGSAGAEVELYMLRRSSRSAFMPDALVFPGGRVETQDSSEGELDDASFTRAAARECMEEASLSLGVDGLRWFDTWQTPSGESPRRFLARFYMTTIAAHEGHDARADEVETHAGRWATPAAILEQWRAQAIDLPPPTLSILMQLEAGEWSRWGERGLEELRRPILPKVASVGEHVHIVLPHDPEYFDLPGDTGEVPARVQGLPRRFVREGKRWIPRQ
ncbi:NUDIX hydrolase [Pseudenhygromyxa sp. WMMC2535]|uniref:NUDIX hydrolase n=1 Tax=Pseudenhygromyxa sp. WMMC2535 TaxID=2712867 RepID=UPI001552CFE9|nr:NUDIX hydrolase [Pseudenhygromyxa sp. WMMC2535]NVB41296.1 NUDIX hydrolase [Pseudenhygromyxa sp. WMMC2535]